MRLEFCALPVTLGPMDRSGLVFVILLCALVAIVLSIVLLDKERTPVQLDDGSLIPREYPVPRQHLLPPWQGYKRLS